LQRFDDGRCPIPSNTDVSLAELAEKSLDVLARDQYSGDDERFKGKSNLAAALQSLVEDSTTDPKARTEFLDRSMGKPKQRVDQTNVNVNLTGWLGQLAEQDSEILDAEFSTPGDSAEEMFK